MSAQFIGISAALGSALAWAVGLILLKMIKQDVPALGLTLITGTIGTVLLGMFMLLTGYTEIQWWPFVVLGVSGVLGISLGDTFFFEALGGLSAHLVVLFGVLGQAFTVVLAVLFLGERISALQWLGIAMIIGGVTGAMYDGAMERGRSTLRGIIFGNLSVVANSASVIVAKVGLAALPAVQGTFVRMLWGALGVALVGLATGRLGGWIRPFGDASTLKKSTAATLVGTFGGFFLFHLSLKNVDVAIASPLSSTEPLFALPLAAIFLAERITVRPVVGTVVAVVGAFLLCA